MQPPFPAPDWRVTQWLNTPKPLALAELRGRVVFVVAFQMLCPGCVSAGLPQAIRARATFPERELAVLGLHTVFEHHEAQGTAAALRAFLHEYRIDFPVGIDEQEPGDPIPRTMRAYGMQGTPTTLLIDRRGYLRLHKFGHLDDMRLGAIIATLISDSPDKARADGSPDFAAGEAEGCAVGAGDCA